MNRFLLALVGAFSVSLCAAQSVVVNWARTDIPPGALQYRQTETAVLSNGNFLVGGYIKTSSSADTERAVVRCIRPNGTLVWERTLAGPALTPGLRVTDLRVLSGSIIFVACTGQSGLITSLSAATGSTLGLGVVGAPTNDAAIGPDGTTFFHSLVSITETTDTPTGSVTTTNRTLVVDRFSNAFARTTVSSPVSSDTYEVSGSDVMNRATEPPRVVITFGQGAAYITAASAGVMTQSNGYEADLLYGRCMKFLPSGNVAWNSTHELEFVLGDGHRLMETTANRMYLGASFANRPTQIIHIHEIKDASTNQWNGYQESLGFDEVTGAFLQAIPEAPFTEYLSQNGSVYVLEDFRPHSTLTWKKYTNASFKWSIGGEALNRFPFQVTSVFNHLGKTRLRRTTDSTGALIDETQLTLSCDVYQDVSENPATGEGLAVGDRTLAGGRMGAFLMRYSQAPVAVGNSYSTARNTVLNGASVLTNDRFGVGARSRILTPTRNGSLTLNLDGTFVYTPRAGFAGSDSFVYQAYRPGIAVFSPATVFITVTP